MSDFKQKIIDKFYIDKGEPCCAGCDHWRWINTVSGECANSPILSPVDRISIYEIDGFSINIGAGLAFTDRDFSCGDFIDSDNLLGVSYES